MRFGSGPRIYTHIIELSVGHVRLAEAVNRKMYIMYYVGIPTHPHIIVI